MVVQLSKNSNFFQKLMQHIEFWKMNRSIDPIHSKWIRREQSRPWIFGINTHITAEETDLTRSTRSTSSNQNLPQALMSWCLMLCQILILYHNIIPNTPHPTLKPQITGMAGDQHTSPKWQDHWHNMQHLSLSVLWQHGYITTSSSLVSELRVVF